MTCMRARVRCRYPMSSVSNQPFDEGELRSWQQVLESMQCALISSSQLAAKKGHIAQASNYAYTEADLTKKIEENRRNAAQSGKQTTRQKMMAQQKDAHANLGGLKKFSRDKFGRAQVGEHEE